MNLTRNSLIHELRIFLNAYGDSDRQVIDQTKQRILNLIEEREECYREIRRLKREA